MREDDEKHTNGGGFLSSDVQRATSSSADGLGYSTSVGHMDDERVVIEASSGGANEDQCHTQDDALKLIRILTPILVSKAYDLKNARCQTFARYKNHKYSSDQA